MKKIILSLILTLSIVLSQVAYIPAIANAEGNDSVNVTVKVVAGGKTILEKTNVNVTNYDLTPYGATNQGNTMAIHAILKALKDNKISYKITDNAQWGASISSIAGIDNYNENYPNGYWAFAFNNGYASSGVGKQTINNGDYIVQYFVPDWKNFDYKYSYFNREDVATDGNKPIELKLIGQDTKGVEGASILLNGQKIDGLVTDNEGKVTIPTDKFKKDDEYIVTAEKVIKETPMISTPYCKITVEGKDTQPPIINPQLKDKTVYSSKYALDVTTTDKLDGNITPIVKSNNEEINPNNNGKYIVTLSEGSNTISIYARDSAGNEITKTISIIYKKLLFEDYNLAEEMNLTAKYLKENNIDEWSAISLNKLGIKGSKEYFNYMINNFNKNVPKKGLDYYTNVELEKLIMYLVSQGYTPYNFNGHDLVKELFNRDINKFDVMDVMFGIFVYDYCNIGDTNYKIKLNDLKNELLDKSFTDENGNLGWSLSGKAPIKPDLVGFAVLALSNWQDDSNIKTTIDEAVNTLSNIQNVSGYYDDGFSGGESSEAVSVSILGLTSVGIDPTDAKFTKGGNNLITALMSFKGSNGQYKHVQDGGNDYMATEEALRALISLNEFYKNGKHNYYDSNINAKELAVYGKLNTDTKGEPTKNTGNNPTTNNNNSIEDENTSNEVEDAEEQLESADLMKTTAINENKDVKDASKSNKSKLPITSGIITLATGAIAAGAYFMFRKDF